VVLICAFIAKASPVTARAPPWNRCAPTMLQDADAPVDAGPLRPRVHHRRTIRGGDDSRETPRMICSVSSKEVGPREEGALDENAVR
jgi:hypothetical protein